MTPELERSTATDADLTLFWSPGSCARVTLVALEETGVVYEQRALPRNDPAAMAEYRRFINPKGKVPALRVGQRVLTETPAIQVYLDRRFPEARLLPQEQEMSLDALITMSWFAAGLHPMINKSRFPMFTSAVPDSFESIRQIALEDLRGSFGQIERRLSDDREWLYGDWTIVDVYLLWCWFRAVGSGLTAPEFPKVDDLSHRCQLRKSVSRILDLEAATYERLVNQGLAVPNAPPLQAGWLP